MAKTWPLTPAGAAATTYEYDADGRRVALKAPGGVTTTFVYDAFGNLMAEYGGVAGSSGGLRFFSQDHLGSTRLVTDGAGVPVRRFDYWPFGMEIFGTDTSYRTAGLGFGAGSNPVVRFTGKERDEGTGLDYFGARYFSGAMGRFTSPDVPLVDQNSEYPQSWNLYAYVRNNPLKYTDPTGEDCVYTNNYATAGTVTVERGDCSQKGGTFVDGTIDTNSLTVSKGALEFGYTGPNGAAGTHSMSLPEPQIPGMLALREAGIRAGRDISTSAILMGGTSTAIASTYVVPAAMGAISAFRAAQLAAALKAAQETWKAMPMEQRRAAMDWLSKIKPGSPPPGPLPPGVNPEALKSYRDVAVKIIQSSKDGVGTQQIRVDAINKALGGK